MAGTVKPGKGSKDEEATRVHGAPLGWRRLRDLVLDRSWNPSRVVSDRHDQARRPPFHDQRNRDDRAGGGGRRRRPGRRTDPELRRRPARPEQDRSATARESSRGRCWHGSTARFSRLASIRPAARSPRPRPTSSKLRPSSARRNASWSGTRSSDLEGRSSSPNRNTTATLANYESAKATLAVSESALVVARADLEEATVNLGYTTIRSPVKGIILDRRINIGQTVVASLNAPSLFLIAKDLSRLEIWSSVNETDIGSIHEGQTVRFTVGAFPRDNFEGKVSQIRLNASMTQNVVTYTVVISVDNAAGRLLPYLTARLQFEVEARKGVLLVPNAALRWQPRVAGCRPRGPGDP